MNAEIKAGTLGTLPLDENPLADWSAHLFVADRTQYIMLCNTKSLLSTVQVGKGITTGRYFIECALNSIQALMKQEGQEFVYERFIAPFSASVRFAKALNRSVSGSMNDMTNHATFWLIDPDLSLNDVAARLNDILLSALAPSKSSGYGKPRDAFSAMLGRKGS